MPKYNNPSDYLIKLAIAPQLVDVYLTGDLLKSKADQHFIKMLNIDEQEFKNLSS